MLLLLAIHVVLEAQLSYSLRTTYSNQTTVPVVRCRPDQASALLQLKSSFSTDDGWGPFPSGSVRMHPCVVAAQHGLLQLGGRSLR